MKNKKSYFLFSDEEYAGPSMEEEGPFRPTNAVCSADGNESYVADDQVSNYLPTLPLDVLP